MTGALDILGDHGRGAEEAFAVEVRDGEQVDAAEVVDITVRRGGERASSNQDHGEEQSSSGPAEFGARDVVDVLGDAGARALPGPFRVPETSQSHELFALFVLVEIVWGCSLDGCACY
ncbi:MAG TPA: hypothetical protein VFX70_07780 [Mycobacteriales bacterium]|nr:hypothetical protein [Mycobacteriales bacterium]